MLKSDRRTWTAEQWRGHLFVLRDHRRDLRWLRYSATIQGINGCLPKVRGLIKSIDGAIRHAERMLANRERAS